MRIVAGEHRGRLLKVPDGLDTRPTTDRVREAIMSSLYSILGGFDGVVVLDAFSGSGAMGLEAMSRGAKFAHLNDFSPKSRTCIEQNSESLHYGSNEVLISGQDVLKSGIPSNPGLASVQYNLIFLDPPYATSQEEVASILINAHSASKLAKGCVIAYEHAEKANENFLEQLQKNGFSILNEKQYGKTYVTYIQLINH